MSVRWHFLGGVRTVTGSRHLLEVRGRKLLLDLGLFQGPRKSADLVNRRLQFNPTEIAAVVVGHAHIDHLGNVPTLVKAGFAGPIYATHATRDLAAHMLRDSAYIQKRDAEFVNKRERRNGSDRVEPLYDEDDVDATLNLFSTQGYGRPFEPLPGVTVTFHPAGHILGAALTRLAVDTGSANLTIGYVVDLGRKGGPFLKDPAQLRGLDVLILESTYGNRLHEDREEAEHRLARVLNDTVARGGRMIIPAFALGRTQVLVQCLARLQIDGRVKPLPVYVDSPLAADVSAVLAAHSEEFDRATYQALIAGDDPLGLRHVTYLRSVEESKRLNEKREPCVIIAASGMCEAGRVLHHLRNHIGSDANTVAIVGYQAQGTLGHRLVQRQDEVRIFGEPFARRARVELLNAFSAHADQADLVAYVAQAGARKVFLVHGEPEPQDALERLLLESGYTGLHRPETGEAVELA
jgi:metallo-beta-lactamase family protein